MHFIIILQSVWIEIEIQVLPAIIEYSFGIYN